MAAEERNSRSVAPHSSNADEIDVSTATEEVPISTASLDDDSKDTKSLSAPDGRLTGSAVLAAASSPKTVGATIKDAWTERLDIWKSVNPLGEISGAFGDVGTLLPIIVALTKKSQINLSSTLLFGGIYGVLTGLWFNTPIPIQPMKSISSVALANNFTLAEVMAAGFYVSCVIGFLGLTGLILPISRAISLPLVRGLQLGTGLVLIINGVTTLQSSQGWSFENYGWLDNYLGSILAFIGIFATYHARWTVSALAIFVTGVVIALVKIYVLYPTATGGLVIGLHLPAVALPDFGSKNAIIGAALGQIPLTMLNSVIAVSKLADDLFPERAAKHRKGVVPLRSVAMSVGLMNIVSCWFGSVPYCHGSGGLAGQYRFGARSGLSLVFLGVLKILVALLFGASLAVLLGYFPNSLLGVMLCATGVELGSVAKDIHEHDDFVVMLVTAGALAGFRNDGIALLCGIVVALLFYFNVEIKRSGWKALPGCIMARINWILWGKEIPTTNDKDVEV